MKTKNAYKQTEIGEIPEEWQVVKAGNIFSLEYGKGLSEKERIRGIYSVVGSNGIVGYHNQALVKGPGIVVGRKGTIGAVTWVDADFWPIDTTYYVKTRAGDISLKWLFYELIRLNPARFHVGDVVPGLKREFVHALKIGLPPLPEQRKIATILSTVDDAIQKTDEIIKKTRLLKKALMQQLLTKGMGHTRFKKTEIGEIPEEWEVVKLGEVIVEAKSGFASGKRDDNGIIQLRMNNITTHGKVLLDSYLKVPVPTNIQDYLLQSNDILFNNTNSVDLIGKTAIFRGEIEKCTYSNHITRIRADVQKVMPKWIFYWLIRKWELGYFRSICVRHVGQAGIRDDDLRIIKISLPPLSEQQKITEILSGLDKNIETESKRKEQLEKVKKGLMQVLLTGKLRVEVN